MGARESIEKLPFKMGFCNVNLLPCCIQDSLAYWDFVVQLLTSYSMLLEQEKGWYNFAANYIFQ